MGRRVQTKTVPPNPETGLATMGPHTCYDEQTAWYYQLGFIGIGIKIRTATARNHIVVMVTRMVVISFHQHLRVVRHLSVKCCYSPTRKTVSLSMCTKNVIQGVTKNVQRFLLYFRGPTKMPFNS